MSDDAKMGFTDNELARLKEYCIEAHEADCDEIGPKVVKIEALLARLAAAEAVVTVAGTCHKCHGCYCDELRAWLRACGKGE